MLLWLYHGFATVVGCLGWKTWYLESSFSFSRFQLCWLWWVFGSSDKLGQDRFLFCPRLDWTSGYWCWWFHDSQPSLLIAALLNAIPLFHMQESTHFCVGGEEWLICGWVNGDVIWQTFGVACLLGLWRWKCRKLVKNSKSCLRAWDLLWYYMDDDAFLRRSFLIFLQFSSASNSSCLQPWNSNSWWTPADWRVESETGLLTC